MLDTTIRVFRDPQGEIPLFHWRSLLLKKNKRAFAKCFSRIQLLEQHGYKLKAPFAKPLHGGIYELRSQSGSEQHRILYFFAGKKLAVLSSGLQKEKKVPDSEIQRSIGHLHLVKKSIEKYSISLDAFIRLIS